PQELGNTCYASLAFLARFRTKAPLPSDRGKEFLDDRIAATVIDDARGFQLKDGSVNRCSSIRRMRNRVLYASDSGGILLKGLPVRLLDVRLWIHEGLDGERVRSASLIGHCRAHAIGMEHASES